MRFPGLVPRDFAVEADEVANAFRPAKLLLCRFLGGIVEHPRIGLEIAPHFGDDFTVCFARKDLPVGGIIGV